MCLAQVFVSQPGQDTMEGKNILGGCQQCKTVASVCEPNSKLGMVTDCNYLQPGALQDLDPPHCSRARV